MKIRISALRVEQDLLGEQGRSFLSVEALPTIVQPGDMAELPAILSGSPELVLRREGETCPACAVAAADLKKLLEERDAFGAGLHDLGAKARALVEEAERDRNLAAARIRDLERELEEARVRLAQREAGGFVGTISIDAMDEAAVRQVVESGGFRRAFQEARRDGREGAPAAACAHFAVRCDAGRAICLQCGTEVGKSRNGQSHNEPTKEVEELEAEVGAGAPAVAAATKADDENEQDEDDHNPNNEEGESQAARGGAGTPAEATAAAAEAPPADDAAPTQEEQEEIRAAEAREAAAAKS